VEKDSAPRDRDRQGRARNARPRDGLGRPLPYGQIGIEQLPDDLLVGPAEALAWAQRLIEGGRPFQAHEVLEAAWKAAPANERQLWRGLAQLAVGLTHLARGNNAGAAALLRRAAGRLAPYGTASPAGLGPHGVDARGLCRWAAALADTIDDPSSGAGGPIDISTPHLRQ
jgi:uncharacterized protein